MLASASFMSVSNQLLYLSTVSELLYLSTLVVGYIHMYNYTCTTIIIITN